MSTASSTLLRTTRGTPTRDRKQQNLQPPAKPLLRPQPLRLPVFSSIMMLLTASFAGCYSTRPIFDRHSTAPNGVETFTNPRYSSSTNWFGWTLVVGTTAGAAYGGYVSGFKMEWSEPGVKEEKPVGNALLFGITTGLTALLINGASVPAPPKEYTYTEQAWLKDLDDNLLYLSSTSSRPKSVSAISTKVETTFVPHSVEDLRLFLQAFPESPERERVALDAAGSLPVSDLPTVLKLFPKTEAADVAGRRLINESENLQAVASFARDHPGLYDEAAGRGIELIRTRSDIETYLTAFPEYSIPASVLSETAVDLSRDDVEALLTRMKDDTARQILARAYFEKSSTVREIVAVALVVPELSEECEGKAAETARTPADFRAYLAAFSDGSNASAIRTALYEKLRTPENLGPNVNSSASEYSPVISPDGSTLYFVRRNTFDNVGTYDDEDIWVSTLDKAGEWSPATNMKELNNRHSNGVNSVTPDGNTLLLHGDYTRFGSSPASLSHRRSYGWSTPVGLDIEDYVNLGRYMQTFLANDGKTILLAIEHYMGRGEHDIYVAFRRSDNSWSPPKNLGPTINTAAGDDTPYLASDGRTLYFSSSGHGGIGESDIFVSRRVDDSWTKWTTPVNLGAPINTAGDDSFFFLPASGDVAYYSSSASGRGLSDIFRVAIPDEMRPLPVVLIKGRVLDGETGNPLEAQVVYEDLATGKEMGVARSDPATGEYKLALPPGSTYGFRAEAPNYLAINDNLDLSELRTYREQQRDLTLVPIRSGQVIRVNNLFFDLGKSSLKSESYPELRRLATLLSERPTMNIEIQGHTDSIGTDDDNLRLSRDRAAAVAAYLSENGIEATRLLVTGFGKARPIAPNETPEGRKRNRRVEIVIKSE